MGLYDGWIVGHPDRLNCLYGTELRVSQTPSSGQPFQIEAECVVREDEKTRAVAVILHVQGFYLAGACPHE